MPTQVVQRRKDIYLPQQHSISQKGTGKKATVININKTKPEVLSTELPSFFFFLFWCLIFDESLPGVLLNQILWFGDCQSPLVQ